jgi:type IV pilus assembly protein PilB
MVDSFRPDGLTPVTSPEAPAGSEGASPAAADNLSSPSQEVEPAPPPGSAVPAPGPLSPPAPHRPGEPEGQPVAVPAASIEKLLAANPFLSACRPADLAEVSQHTRAFECPQGALLLDAGAPSAGLGVLVHGVAHALGRDRDDQALVEALRAPDVFGETVLLGAGRNLYAVTAVTVCRVLWIPEDAIRWLAARAPWLTASLSHRHAMRFARRESAPAAPSDLALRAVPAAPVPGVPAPASPGIGPRPSAGVSPSGIIRFVEVGEFDLSPSVLSLVPPKLVRQHRLLPLRLSGNRLTVGMVAPRNLTALTELKRTLQSLELEVVAISADDYAQAVVRHRIEDARHSTEERKRAVIQPDALQFETAEFEREPPSAPKAAGEEVVRYVNRIFAAGLERDASDIHLEPVSAGLRVRFRVHGVLVDWGDSVPAQLARSVVARLKVMAGLDIAERRRPQDGRIGVRVNRREIDVRVSCLPCARGEKLVLRVLDSAMATRPLAQVFLYDRVLEAARRALNRPYGGIVVAGATGAGKTSTLYAMLNERRTTRPDTHVTMVEEPIEYRLEGVTQVQVDPGANLGFAQILRSMLRQDPDVIVVGEMRDPETAKVGLEAAMTGHVLLTSLHANQALAVVQRLEDLGCGRPLISLSLALVLVQRLVRRLCNSCRRQVEAPPALVESLILHRVLEPGASPLLAAPVGCDACGRSGFVGRVAVFEAMQLNDEVRHLLAAGAPLAEVEKAALATGALIPFASYAGYLLGQGLISGSEALLSVAD